MPINYASSSRSSRRRAIPYDEDSPPSKRHAASNVKVKRDPRESLSSSNHHRQEDNDAQQEEEEEDTILGDAQEEAQQDDAEDQLEFTKAEKMPVSEAALKASKELDKAVIYQKANDLVRLALACEYQKIPLKREDISKKVMQKDGSRCFPVIFNRAQKVLRHTFGYILVELRQRGAENIQLIQQSNAAAAVASAELQDGARRRKGKDKDDHVEPATKDDDSKKGGSRTWVLQSALPIQLIRKLGQPWDNLKDSLGSNAVGTSTKAGSDPDGVVLDWSKADSQQGSMGLLYLILALILLNGRSMREDELRAHLKRLYLFPGKFLPGQVQPDFTGASSENMTQSHTQAATQSRSRRAESGSATLDSFLDLMIKQQYLECQRADGIATGGRTQGTQARGGRGRPRSGADEDYVPYDWKWGSRAEAELTEEQISRLIIAITLDERASPSETDDGASSFQRQATQSKRAERRNALFESIARAAGSQLTS